MATTGGRPLTRSGRHGSPPGWGEGPYGIGGGTGAVAFQPGADEPLVEIKVRDNGPYKVTGPIRLVDVDGQAWELPPGHAVALCRCGQSRSKPFCDRSH